MKKTIAALLVAGVIAGGDDWKPFSVQTQLGEVIGRLGGGALMDHCLFDPLAREAPGSPDVASFYGIPYAEPPVGDLRFAPPKPREAWSGKLQATSFPPICAQLPLVSAIPSWMPGWSYNEDCLTLNVWTQVPLPANESLRPVLVFIHGGGFVTGNGYTEFGCSFYSGNQLAPSEGLVVVTMNYRLGALGFTDLPELRQESGTAGNYGIQDQRLALQWVQANIRQFGGDPTRVTLMGESAGAVSVLHHVVSPRSHGLVQRAIVESVYTLPDRQRTQTAHRRFRTFAAELGCDGTSEAVTGCLRKRSVKEILSAEKALWEGGTIFDQATEYYPVADGYELPEGEDLMTAYEKLTEHVPLLIGSNLNETSLFMCSSLKANMDAQTAENKTQSLLELAVGKQLPDSQLQELMAEYPVKPKFYDSWRSATIAAISDVIFGCPTRRVAKTTASVSDSKAKVYRYLLGRSPWFFHADKCLGVPHIADTFYVFYNDLIGKAMSDDDRKLATAMSKAWFSFARGEEPELPAGFSTQPWPAVDHSEALLWLDVVPHIEASYRSSTCDTIDKLVYGRTSQREWSELLV
eukprot:TRINITY_DN107694_c0_g1_i1.p1 TRINITY_DN107694_c0_g1~~TRINITY_DN107694_c0_g1_i1.p1  ORF type:complete len:578 (-),score=89.93 TRINITY_DN107694_c0_g1_i1:253-1986(-)